MAGVLALALNNRGSGQRTAAANNKRAETGDGGCDCVETGVQRRFPGTDSTEGRTPAATGFTVT